MTQHPDAGLPEGYDRQLRWLRFDEPVVQASFTDDHAARRLPQFRLVLWVGIALQVPLTLRSLLVEDVPATDPRYWLRLLNGVGTALMTVYVLGPGPVRGRAQTVRDEVLA